MVAGRLVRLACKRFLDDLKNAKRKGLRFDDDKADTVIDFFQTFIRHVKGKEWAGQLVTLEPWQVFVEANLFGWYRKNENGDWVRRFRKSYEQVARKNGKSFRLAGRGLYLGFFDGEEGAEVYSAATKKDQARICFDMAKRMVQKESELADEIEVMAHNMNSQTTGSKFEPQGADYDTMDGLNPHGALIDELHAHRDSGVVDVLETGMASRLEPMLCMITTAGFSKTSACWDERCYGEQILEGLEDDSYFAFIAEPDEGDDWTNEAIWEKGNPNLGVSVKIDYLRSMMRQALESPARQNDFKRKNLDIWTEQDVRWLPIELWDACSADVDLGELACCECYGGLDLAAVKDTNSFSLVFPPEKAGGTWTVLLWVWLPEHDLAERAKRDRAPYDAWRDFGYIETTEGNIADYDFIRARINQLGELYAIQEIGFDPWNATQLATQLEGDGFHMYQMRQGYKTLSEPMKQLEALVRDRRLAHGSNPVLRWMVSNTAIRMDENENIAPTKKASSGRIDGVLSTVMAIGRIIVQPEEQGSKYNQGAEMLTVGLT
jgi:phage terminase large subunit-like protein